MIITFAISDMPHPVIFLILPSLFSSIDMRRNLVLFFVFQHKYKMMLKDENGIDHCDRVNSKNSSFDLCVILENREETDEPQLKTLLRIQKKAKPQQKSKVEF